MVSSRDPRSFPISLFSLYTLFPLAQRRTLPHPRSVVEQDRVSDGSSTVGTGLMIHVRDHRPSPPPVSSCLENGTPTSIGTSSRHLSFRLDSHPGWRGLCSPRCFGGSRGSTEAGKRLRPRLSSDFNRRYWVGRVY